MIMTISLLSVKYPKVYSIIVKLGIAKYLLKKNEVEVGEKIQHSDNPATGRVDDFEQGDNKIFPCSVSTPKEIEVYDDNKAGFDNPKNSISEIVLDNPKDTTFYNRSDIDINPTP